MDRDVAAFVFPDKGACLIVGGVSGVAFCGDGKVNDGLCQCQFAFRAAKSFVGSGGIVGDLDGARVGQTDVFS